MSQNSVGYSELTKAQIGDLLEVKINFSKCLMLHIRELLEKISTTEMSRQNISLLLDFYDAVNALTEQDNADSSKIVSKRIPRRASEPLQ